MLGHDATAKTSDKVECDSSLHSLLFLQRFLCFGQLRLQLAEVVYVVDDAGAASHVVVFRHAEIVDTPLDRIG